MKVLIYAKVFVEVEFEDDGELEIRDQAHTALEAHLPHDVDLDDFEVIPT